MALDAAIIKRIRVLIPDTEQVFGDAGDEYMFTDEDLEAYYAEGFENVKCAAGLIKMAIGASEALILKKIRNYETNTDGALLMKQWTEQGIKLYDRGLEEIARIADDEGIFEVAYPQEEYLRHPEGMSHGSYRIGGWL